MGEFETRRERRERERRIQELNDEIDRKQKEIETGEALASQIEVEVKRLEAQIDKESQTRFVLQVGPWRPRRNANAQGVAKAFIALHLAAITAGIVFIFQSSPMKELGIALVVGGLFAFGTLLSAIWSAIFNNEHQLISGAERGQLRTQLESHAVILKGELQARRNQLHSLLSSRKTLQ